MSQSVESAANNSSAEARGGADALDRIAAGLYGMASMLVGAGEAGAELVETAVATAELTPGSGEAAALQAARRALAKAAIALLAQRAPGSLDAPADADFPASCIGDDELDAAGDTGAEVERMLSGPDRGRVRTWLESLPVEQRVIFVLRAVGGFSPGETAALLAAHGGAGAAGWMAEPVREVFRQALCSLASQLLHEANTH